MASIFLRTVIMYIVIHIMMRFSGKRQLGELQLTELSVTILISELAAIPMQDPDAPILHGVVAIIALICLEVIISFICIKSAFIKRLFEGNACIILENGRLNQKQMKNVRLTIDDLMEALRQKGITRLETVGSVILESSGKLSIILKEKYSPVTKNMVFDNINEAAYPITVISDGKFLNKGLKKAQITKTEIIEQLKIRGFKNERDIFYMALNGTDKPTIIKKE